METSPAITHAQNVARTVVRLGFADVDTTRQHYQDFLFYLNLGFEGSFSQILHARRVIDDHGYQMLERISPFHLGSGRHGMQSQVLQLPGSDRFPAQAPGGKPSATLMYDGVYPTPQGGRPNATVMYEGVLPTPPRDRAGSPSGSGGGAPPKRPRPATVILPDDELPSGKSSTHIDTQYVDTGPPGSSPGESEIDLFFPELNDSRTGTGKHAVAPKQLPERPGESFDPITTLGLHGGDDFGDDPEKFIHISGERAGPAVVREPPSTAGDDSRDEADPADTGELFWQTADSGEEVPAQTFLQPRLGGFLGEFELLEVLGQGGMGVVFKTRRQKTGKLYALKVLRVRQGAKTESRRKRFRREVKAMQRLQHENIVRVHGYGRDGPFDWYVMEYVDGKDLSTLLTAGALNLDQKLEVFCQMCESLVHSHVRGVIHRDLKPGNVLVDTDLKAHLLDFGLAKILDTESGLTHTGSALGTPFYMSPEQVADPTQVGPRSDVFSLGVILYEMITGQRPFLGHTAGEVGNKILTLDPPSPTELQPEIPVALDSICARAMEKKPERRYQTVKNMLEDLRRHRAGKAVKGQSALSGLRRWVDKNRSGLVMGMLVASVFFTVLGILIGIVYVLTSL